MELSKVYKLYVIGVNKEDGTFTAHFTHTGINENGIILWNHFDREADINARLLEELHPIS